jgi:hypothetical protein
MRHNPRHSKEGKELIEKFDAELCLRPALADLAGIEGKQQEEAAVRMQAAARGHTARLLAGEQKAATRVQAAVRGRAARRDMEAMDAAAEKVQANIRGRNVRLQQQSEREQMARAQAAAATALQSAMRGRMVRGVGGGDGDGRVAEKDMAAAEEVAPAMEAPTGTVTTSGEEALAATRVQAAARGHSARARVQVEGEAATKVQAIARGHSARRARD